MGFLYADKVLVRVWVHRRRYNPPSTDHPLHRLTPPPLASLARHPHRNQPSFRPRDGARGHAVLPAHSASRLPNESLAGTHYLPCVVYRPRHDARTQCSQVWTSSVVDGLLQLAKAISRRGAQAVNRGV